MNQSFTTPRPTFNELDLKPNQTCNYVYLISKKGSRIFSTKQQDLLLFAVQSLEQNVTMLASMASLNTIFYIAVGFTFLANHV